MLHFIYYVIFLITYYFENLPNLLVWLVGYVSSQATKSKTTTHKFKAKITFNTNFAEHPLWMIERNIIHLS